ncbi:MAG: hypothetical protein KDI03_02620 [Anaerolineae bacterium]|nr:hypothetical protein [Anaerolineae bacterium]MCB0252703.1 hypothetical protein [Anaerolineae bacterium]
MNRLAWLFFSYAIGAILLAGCVSPPPADPITASLNEPLILAVGDSTTIDGDVLTLTSIVEDSRCPSQVECAWTGRAVLQFHLNTPDGQRNDFQLITIHSPARTTQAVQAGHIFTLNTLEPYPETPDHKIPQRDYRATVTVAPLATAECPLHENDPDGYLTLICRHISDNDIDVKPADPAGYQIKDIQETTENGRPVAQVFLNCCGLGDFAVIDIGTGEVLSFRTGDF